MASRSSWARCLVVLATMRQRRAQLAWARAWGRAYMQRKDEAERDGGGDGVGYQPEARPRGTEDGNAVVSTTGKGGKQGERVLLAGGGWLVFASGSSLTSSSPPLSLSLSWRQSAACVGGGGSRCRAGGRSRIDFAQTTHTPPRPRRQPRPFPSTSAGATHRQASKASLEIAHHIAPGPRAKASALLAAGTSSSLRHGVATIRPAQHSADRPTTTTIS